MKRTGDLNEYFKEFREFAVKGNMIDLAVGVIIGGAFGKIVDSLVKDIIMPIITLITGGGVDFTQKFIVLGKNPNNLQSLAEMQKAGVNVLTYGNFLTILINFIILAWVVFVMVKLINKCAVNKKQKLRLHLLQHLKIFNYFVKFVMS
jgi:large conductance mechanosensitive channel